MKKNLIAVAVLATSVFGAASASAADGQIRFNGEIIGAACEVISTTTSPLAVTMGKVNKSAFTAAGSTAAPTAFSLVLKNCPDTVTSATIKFDGTAKDGDNRVLDLTQGAGVATGVGIQLSDKAGAVLPLFSASPSYALVSGTAVNTLDFVARYVSTAAAVTAGPANAVTSFSVNYN